MKIGINTLFMVPGDVGGTETYLRKTLQAIAQNFPKVPLVLYTTLDNNDLLSRDLKKYPQIEFKLLKIRAAFRPIRIFAEQTLLPFKARNEQIDVLWSPGYTAPMYCPYPQVVTIPDLQYKSHPDDMSLLERKTLDFLVRNSCRRSKAVITISKFSRDEVVRYDFATSQKVFPICLGVEESFGISVGAEQVPNSSNLPTTRPYILCVAHSYPHKNIHLLVDAYANIQNDIHHDLVIVGTARRGECLVKNRLNKVKDLNRVHRLSGLDFLSLKYLFQQADLFVLPSSYEGFGLPVLEAMMAETLVITANKASIPEVAGSHVIYCEPLESRNLGDSIVKALGLKEDVKINILEKAKHRAEMFTWERTAKETMQVLCDVARSS